MFLACVGASARRSVPRQRILSVRTVVSLSIEPHVHIRRKRKPTSTWCMQETVLAVSARKVATNASTLDIDVVQGGAQEGLLMLQRSVRDIGSQETRTELKQGSIVHHRDRDWICIFQVDRFWFAVPVNDAQIMTQCHGEACDIGTISECLNRATPTQVERAQLSDGVSTGIVALDVLAPLGRGQSLLICGPKDSGKTVLSCDVLERLLDLQTFDKVFRFCTDPSAPALSAAVPCRHALVEFLASPEGAANSVLTSRYLSSLFTAVAAAEHVRDSGKHALLVLDSLSPMIEAWDLAVKWAEIELSHTLHPESLAGQRRAFFANLLERAANLASGGSLTLLALVDTAAFAAIGFPGERRITCATGDKDNKEKTYGISDFVGRKESELERLRNLQERGIALTAKTLSAVGISLPEGDGGSIQVSSSSAMRELQSLSDGQVVLDKSMAEMGLFPSIVPGTTFSRFGLGSTETGPRGSAQRDVRPTALQAVSAHLRVELALELEARFRPPLEGFVSTTAKEARSADVAQSSRMEAVRAVLLQPQHAHVQMEEMVAMLLAACSGAFDKLPVAKVAQLLRGGLQAPLLQHLRSSAPRGAEVLRKLKEKPHVSTEVARELDIVVRLFVALHGPPEVHKR